MGWSWIHAALPGCCCSLVVLQFWILKGSTASTTLLNTGNGSPTTVTVLCLTPEAPWGTICKLDGNSRASTAVVLYAPTQLEDLLILLSGKYIPSCTWRHFSHSWGDQRALHKNRGADTWDEIIYQGIWDYYFIYLYVWSHHVSLFS